MCDDLDNEGVRRWFYGGTPPLDEPRDHNDGANTRASAPDDHADEPAGENYAEHEGRELASL